MRWNYFFECHGSDEIASLGYEEAGPGDVGTVEELYQHFKARMVAEIADTLANQRNEAPDVRETRQVPSGWQCPACGTVHETDEQRCQCVQRAA